MRTTQAGFTLTEILVALVILAIGMLGLSNLTVANIRGNAVNKEQTIASALLQDRMEQAKRAGYAGNTAAETTEGYGTMANYSAYKRVTTVVANTPAPNIKTITVTVWWHSDDRSMSATTLLAQ